jgi:hypothetical protein
LTNKVLFWIDVHYIQFGIAKFLQEKIPADFYVIYDLNHNLKKSFSNQNIVNFKKQWFYWDYQLNISKDPDIEYLKLFEKKYGIDLWKIAFSERIFSDFQKFHNFTREEILSILENDCKFFEKVLEEVNPDFLIIKLADFHRTQLLVELCTAKGIKVLMLIQSRLGFRSYISSSINKSENYVNIKNNEKSMTFSELQEYLKKFDKFKQTSKAQSGGIGIPIKDKIKAFLKWIFQTYDDEYSKTYVHLGVTIFQVLKNIIIQELTRNSRHRFLEKNSIIHPNFKEKFIYFPLHVQPERNIDIDAPYYSNQLVVIENIARSLPIQYKLYVKEHNSMKFRNWRQKSFYNSVLNLPNVKLIHPLSNPLEIIKNCSLVITIAGSTGLEAAFYEKPTIVLADVSYSNLSCIKKIKNFEELPDAIKESLIFNVDPDELRDFIQYQEKNSFEFDEVELSNELSKISLLAGMVTNDKMTVNQLDSFFEQKRELFEPLVTDYIKKINEHGDSLTKY